MPPGRLHLPIQVCDAVTPHWARLPLLLLLLIYIDRTIVML